MQITEITNDGMFHYIHLANGNVIRMTSSCLADLGWKVGTIIGRIK